MKKILLLISCLTIVIIGLILPTLHIKSEEIIITTKAEKVNEPIIEHSIEIVEKNTVEKTEKDPITLTKEKMEEELCGIENIIDDKEWFLAYKDIIFRYAKWVEMPKTIYDVFSKEEIMIMFRIVETETYDQKFENKCNVASVIFNRIKQIEHTKEFGISVMDVLTKENSFSYWRTAITEDTILAVMYAFEIEDTTNGALFFHSNDWTEVFWDRKWIFTDSCGHHFY